MLKGLIDKASVLIDALPFLQRFKGNAVVVKVGGSTLENPGVAESIMTDISFMSTVGMRPVIVHGGGKAITQGLQRANIQTEFINGLRVTDKKTIQIVAKVLNEEIAMGIVNAISAKGMKSRAIPGTGIIRSTKHWAIDPETGERLDLGFVGDVISVDPRPIEDLVSQYCIPVISPLGLDDSGNVYNNNADTAAAEVAIAIRARKLVFLSDVHGIMRKEGDESTFISSLHSHEVEKLFADGVVKGGMLPKVTAGIKAVKSGVRKTHIIDGNMKHSLLLELFTEEGIGTEILS